MNTDLGSLIQAAREAEGLSRARLGRAVGRDQSTVHRWETNRVRPDGEAGQRLIEVLGLDPDEFWRVAGEPVRILERTDVPSAIRADPRLSADAKAHLLWIYEAVARDKHEVALDAELSRIEALDEAANGASEDSPDRPTSRLR